MANATYLVTKSADIFKILSERKGKLSPFDIEDSLIYSCQKVRSNENRTTFIVSEDDIIDIPESDVFMTDTNYWTVRYGVDRALGIID